MLGDCAVGNDGDLFVGQGLGDEDGAEAVADEGIDFAQPRSLAVADGLDMAIVVAVAGDDALEVGGFVEEVVVMVASSSWPAGRFMIPRVMSNAGSNACQKPKIVELI
jgi:hypothetical protein